MRENRPKSYHHRGGEPALLGLTIDEHFKSVVAEHPDREAVVSVPQGRRLTYRKFDEEIETIARGLVGFGFGKGDRIGVWSTNNIEWLLVQMATARIGAILVNVNPAYRARELVYALQKSAVQGLVAIPSFRTSDYVGMLLEAVPALGSKVSRRLESVALPALRHVVVYDPKDPAATVAPAPGFSTWADLLGAASSADDARMAKIAAEIDRDDPINIQYTSGTTGFPKAVLLTHHNILNNAWFVAQAMHFGPDDRLCVPVPFYHCFGMVLANLLCFSVGACLVIACEHFDAGEVLYAVDKEKCTAVHGVPTMFIGLLEHPDFVRLDLSSLRTGIMAGAPCPPALMRKVMDDVHCPEILIGYGETEASPITHLTTRSDSLERRTETVGRNLQHQEVKVIDTQSGRTVALGEIGEICFRGYHVMRGYYGDAEATHKAIDERGWLRSGDLGTMDADGYVRITGRLKEMIIRGGENIYPREIEDFLFTHPKVAEVAVFGIPDERYGEEVMAWVQLREGEQATEQELREFCKGKISHFKIPRFIWFVDEMPMTVTGKVQKFRMKEMAIEKMKARV
jgi:fatty-acyl-CoA synthase